jgi:hypothetical protein
MNAKEILEENINYCQILMRLLARFGTDEDYKIRYMSIVEGFETEEQIMPNRIRLRRYLRELMINQKLIDCLYEYYRKKFHINLCCYFLSNFAHIFFDPQL